MAASARLVASRARPGRGVLTDEGADLRSLAARPGRRDEGACSATTQPIIAIDQQLGEGSRLRVPQNSPIRSARSKSGSIRGLPVRSPSPSMRNPP